jgi:hypothetical protein
VKIYDGYDQKDYSNPGLLESKKDDWEEDEQIESSSLLNFSSIDMYTSFPRHMDIRVKGIPIKIYGITDVEALAELKLAMTELFTPVSEEKPDTDWVLPAEHDQEFRDLLKLYLEKVEDESKKELIQKKFHENHRWLYRQSDIPDLLRILWLRNKPYFQRHSIKQADEPTIPRILAVKAAIEEYFAPVTIEEEDLDLLCDSEELEILEKDYHLKVAHERLAHQKKITLEEICIQNQVGIVYVEKRRLISFGAPIPNLQ